MGQVARAGRRVRTWGAAIGLVGGGLLIGGASPVAVSASDHPIPTSVVVGVDHADPANQDFQHGRVFEYTDFFSRDITVATGEVVDFRTAPGSFHIVALASSESAARAVYPAAVPDTSDPNAPNGAPKLGVGPGQVPIERGSATVPFGPDTTIAFNRGGGPPLCGVPYAVSTGPGQTIPATPPCSFTGGNDIEVAGPNLNSDEQGNPLPADWNVAINAPAGTYHYFCTIHPGMRGTVHVVAGGADGASRVTTQAQIDKASAAQFGQDREAAVRAEAKANVVSFTGDAPGTRTYLVRVGIAAANDHVAIDEMLPNPQTVAGGPPHLTGGDTVHYLWADDHNFHSVFFPAQPPRFANDTPPIGLDCGEGYVPFGNGPPGPCTGEEANEQEVIFDPGTTSSGTALHSPTDPANAGVLTGAAEGVHPSVQSWSVAVAGDAAPGLYLFHCTIHDWMVGGFSV